MTDHAIPISERGRIQIRVSRDTLTFIDENPTIWRWTNTIENENTRLSYAYRLMLILKELNQSPDQFLEAIRSKPDDMGITIDGLLAGMHGRQAAISSAAIKRFAKFYRARGFELTYQVKKKRSREKRPLPWDDALRIIKECPTPYREVFRFMLYGALDEHTFSWINWNSKLGNGKGAIDEINSQISNDKPYVRIDLPPRKSGLDRYFILVPKAYVPPLPAMTVSGRGKGKGGRLLVPRNMAEVWQHAAQNIELYYEGMGPHKLRTTFRTKCADLGIPVVAAWQMGHGGEQYGYDLSGMDEAFILDGPLENGIRKGGLRQLWANAPMQDTRSVNYELSKRDSEIAGIKGTTKYLIEYRIRDLMEINDDIYKEYTSERDPEETPYTPEQIKERMDEIRDNEAEIERLKALLAKL
jgi:integrase